MAKVYEVTIPSHQPNAGTYRVVAGSVGAVKDLICKSMDRGRVPRGTEINKVGLSKEPDSLSLFSKSKAATKPARKIAAKRAAKTSNDNARSPKPRGRGKTAAPTTKKKLSAEERAEKRIADERADTINIRGIQLRKSQGIKLTKNLIVTEASFIVEKDGRYDQIAVGEDAEIVLSKGHTIWMLCDHGRKMTEALAK